MSVWGREWNSVIETSNEVGCYCEDKYAERKFHRRMGKRGKLGMGISG